jgi:hypothetical protein
VDAIARETATLTRDLDALKVGTTGLRTDLTSLSSSVSDLNTRIVRDAATLDRRLQDINSRLGPR